MAEKFKKYEYLDSMRGIAILLVVLGHVGNMIGDQSFKYFPEFISQFIYNGHLGVQMFFVVSAYTLLMSHDNRKGESHATKKFFIRRFFRIAPMYYLAIIFTTLQFIDFNFHNFNWQTFHKTAFLTNLFFVNALSPTTINNYVIGGWSISVEMLFYLILPLICSKIKTLNGYITFTLLTLFLSSFLFYILSGTRFDGNEFLRYYFFNHLPVFGLGMTAYIINKNIDQLTIKPKVLLLILFSVFIYCYITIPYGFMYSLIYFMLLMTLSHKPYKVLSNKLLSSVGKVSFSIYLVHFMVMYFIARFDLLQFIAIKDTLSAYLYFILLFIALSVVSYFISCFTYKYIELKGQNIGRYIISKLN